MEDNRQSGLRGVFSSAAVTAAAALAGAQLTLLVRLRIPDTEWGTPVSAVVVLLACVAALRLWRGAGLRSSGLAVVLAAALVMGLLMWVPLLVLAPLLVSGYVGTAQMVVVVDVLAGLALAVVLLGLRSGGNRSRAVLVLTLTAGVILTGLAFRLPGGVVDGPFSALRWDLQLLPLESWVAGLVIGAVAPALPVAAEPRHQADAHESSAILKP